MRKLIYVAALGLMATGAFAQKANVKAAEKVADSNVAEARNLAKAAREHEETKADPYAWYVSGLIEQKEFQMELTKAQLQQPHNEALMYGALMNEVPYFLETYRLESIPNEKGKVKLKYAKKAKDMLKSDHPLLVNAGYFYIQNKEYAKSAEAFDNYIKVRKHPLFADDKAIATVDTAMLDASYLLVAACYEGKLYDKAVAYGQQFKDQDYKGDDIHQLISASLLAKADTVAAMKMLEEGAAKFPKQPYYFGNIINIYAIQGNNDGAIDYLKKAINQDPTNTNYLIAMGGLYERKEDWNTAADWYKKALDIKGDDFDANHNLGRSYYNQAVTLLNAAELDKLTEDKAKALFEKAYPFLENAYKQKPDEVYYVLANVCDRLGKKQRYDEIMAAHK
ncbi:MAG: hypothetical protein Q4A64_06265 [Porphyromonadaceae bacterium]|nr:hypothetical protein [Porphyromonadaceae bacterium]